MSEVTKEEFDEWKQHPVTHAFFDAIQDQRNAVAEQLLGGRFLGTGLNQEHAVMAVKIYDEVINTEFEDHE